MTYGLVQECRLQILANRIGLLSNDDLVQWADAKIVELDEPPIFVLDLAAGELPVNPPALDTIRNEASDQDVIQLISRILNLWNAEKMTIAEVGARCYQFALIAEVDLAAELHWISDEIHLCEIGVKAWTESLPRIRAALHEISRNAF